MNELKISKNLNLPRLVIFDMDGTLVDEPNFYRPFYSGSLNQVILEERGAEGFSLLELCRERYEGKGELSLLALNVPFRRWAERIVTSPLDAITPQPETAELLRSFRFNKVVYTGSPREFAPLILERFGFKPSEDFDLILGWQEPELFPTKWTCSPLIFASIMGRFQSTPEETWSVGDNWETDLMPAQSLGITTVQIGKVSGNPDFRFPKLRNFLDYLKGVNL